jgi:hypothetical protein
MAVDHCALRRLLDQAPGVPAAITLPQKKQTRICYAAQTCARVYGVGYRASLKGVMAYPLHRFLACLFLR